jgi:hypothetical protein
MVIIARTKTPVARTGENVRVFLIALLLMLYLIDWTFTFALRAARRWFGHSFQILNDGIDLGGL